jgi:hypothetical protein
VLAQDDIFGNVLAWYSLGAVTVPRGAGTALAGNDTGGTGAQAPADYRAFSFTVASFAFLRLLL